jgi:hypothetical protein
MNKPSALGPFSRMFVLQDGQLAYELAGLGNDASPMAITGDGRVVLACTNRGSIISIAWPKDPEAAGRRQQEEQQQSRTVSSNSMLAADPAVGIEDATADTSGHAGQAMRHLSVQIGAGPLLSPGSSGLTTAAKTPGSALSARTPHTAKTPHRAAAAARTPGSCRALSSPSLAAANNASTDPQQPQQHQQLQVVLESPGTPTDSSDAYSVPTSPGPMSPGPLSHGPASPSRSSRAWPAADQGNAAAAVTPGHVTMKEYRLHSSRITAIKVLHTAGVVFTARWVSSAQQRPLAAGSSRLECCWLQC